MPGIEVPFVLTGADLPEGINTSHHDDPYSQFLAEAAEAEINSWGVVVNSFLELEGNFVSPLESFYQNGAKAWCLGPLCLYDDSEECFHGSLDRHQHEVIMKWLDEHTVPASVIFVCFGTQAHIPPAQLDEVWLQLSVCVLFPKIGIEIPFVLTCADLPEGVNIPHHGDPYSQFMSEAAEFEFHSWGGVVNSFLELEGNYVSSLEPFYQNGAKVWCAGPLCLYDNSDECFRSSLDQHQHEVILNWLAKHSVPASVIFVSFGTQSHISTAQLDEVCCSS
ncbi:hypothetical protein RHGRI_031432 [Rhododendron griersonianum]|uniref:Uncharacterized protein n=1 Tax=Rhododendron griersonianum TaxID=479676 RepID=A0AAV6I869_9ERIC|nr:hypothetical protein RHGRI_031432 [Rhododendron griersonianum]